MKIAKIILNECKKNKVDDVFVSVENQKGFQVKFSNSKIITTENSNNTSITVFLSLKRRLAMTTIRDFSEQAAKKTVNDLVSFAKNLPKNPEYNGIAKGPFEYRKLKEESYVDTSVDGINQVKDVIAQAKSAGATRTAGVWESSFSTVNLFTSGKVEAYDAGGSYYFSLRAFCNDGSGHSVCSATDLKELTVSSSVKEAVDVAKRSVSASTLDPGKYDVLFYPLPIANLISAVGDSSSIFSVESGMSFLAGSLNKQVASPIFTLFDDPTDNKGVGSSQFDAEGVPTQRTPIIENGELKNYLHNTSSSKKYNVKTTANAGLVSPEAMNLIVGKGNVNKEKLISDFKDGLVVTNLWYTRFQNSATGDFSTVPRDGIFKVEKGVYKPVKDIRISDNLPQMLKNISAVADDHKWIVGWEVDIPTKSPSILIKDVNITKSVE